MHLGTQNWDKQSLRLWVLAFQCVGAWLGEVFAPGLSSIKTNLHSTYSHIILYLEKQFREHIPPCPLPHLLELQDGV